MSTPEIDDGSIFYVLDEQKADLYQLFTHIKTQDQGMVYTTWSVFRGLEYFESLLESGVIDGLHRTINFEFLNVTETCAYIDLLSTGRRASLSKISTSSCLSIYKQLDFHLIKSNVRKTVIQEIESRDYSNELYDFNVDYKIIDVEHIAIMFAGQDPKKMQIPANYDPIFFEWVFKRLRGNCVKAWEFIRNLPPHIVGKHISVYNPGGSLKKFSHCINSYSSDPNLMVFIQHILNKWATQYKLEPTLIY